MEEDRVGLAEIESQRLRGEGWGAVRICTWRAQTIGRRARPVPNALGPGLSPAPGVFVLARL
jgi:hypothetical protein